MNKFKVRDLVKAESCGIDLAEVREVLVNLRVEGTCEFIDLVRVEVLQTSRNFKIGSEVLLPRYTLELIKEDKQ